MPAGQVYDTKPLECWGKMKELRRWRFRNNWEAKKRGDLVIMGEHMGMRALWAGFGSDYYAVMSVSPYWTGAKRNPKEILRLLEYVESKGYGRQVCGALRIHLAHLLMGESTKSPEGETVIPDFIWQLNFCPQVSRLGYIASKILNVPYLYVEPLYAEDVEKARTYLVEQMHEAIEKAQKLTRRQYDDEKLVEATRRELQTIKLLSQVCELNKNIPAPLSGRHLVSLNLVATVMGHTKEAVEFYGTLLDEVRDRVKNKIAACGFEKKRLQMDSFPWPMPWFLRYPETYGAVVVSGDHPFLNAQFEEDENGKWVVRKGFDELCANMATREDAFKALAWLWTAGTKVNHHGIHNWHIERLAGYPIRMAKEWQCDGIVFSVNHDCFQQMHFAMEAKLLADAERIPNMLFYSILTDLRHFSPSKLKKAFDAFLTKELGLTKLFEDNGRPEEEIF
jgi:benzoyl-CoA reductase/2-hydroxyglutaryl-CoA dehydratase subunit BcrC/BadD/HgdB